MVFEQTDFEVRREIELRLQIADKLIDDAYCIIKEMAPGYDVWLEQAGRFLNIETGSHPAVKEK